MRNKKHEDYLFIFLSVDDLASAKGNWMTLRGIRRAQIKLATHYLKAGEEELAKEIFHDMVSEPVARIERIYTELMGLDTKEYWEIVSCCPWGCRERRERERERERERDGRSIDGLLIPNPRPHPRKRPSDRNTSTFLTKIEESCCPRFSRGSRKSEILGGARAEQDRREWPRRESGRRCSMRSGCQR